MWINAQIDISGQISSSADKKKKKEKDVLIIGDVYDRINGRLYFLKRLYNKFSLRQ